MDVRAGPQIRLNMEEMLLWGSGFGSSRGLQSSLDSKEIELVNPKGSQT